ncbi:hypothetical protein CK203_096845 [Vitis vinifera]|uniref:Uncharacterized protein n=1 Tax=Vitis vinifera TaxID=29760 RepID=A0A438BPN9_VITVI|nr:hypothetical protein CK203_096845 [Vitis vinifera]
MSSVVLMLGSEGALPQPKEPGFFTQRIMMEANSSLSRMAAFSAWNSTYTHKINEFCDDIFRMEFGGVLLNSLLNCFKAGVKNPDRNVQHFMESGPSSCCPCRSFNSYFRSFVPWFRCLIAFHLGQDAFASINNSSKGKKRSWVIVSSMLLMGTILLSQVLTLYMHQYLVPIHVSNKSLGFFLCGLVLCL